MEWKSLQDKGVLLYRNVKSVRTNFERVAAAPSPRRQAMISLGGPQIEEEI